MFGMAAAWLPPRLLVESEQRRRILRHGRWQHLDRHDAIHAAMPGLEDLPHATGPDLVEDGVVAQDQGLGFARLDLRRLERRQVARS